MGYFDLASGCQTVSTQMAGAAPGGPNTGTAVDTQGAHTAFFVVQVGTITSSRTYDIVVHMSDTSDFSSYVTVTGATFGQYSTSSHERVDVGRLNLKACKRYIRTNGTAAGSGDCPLDVTVLLSMENTADSGGVSVAAGQTAPYAASFNLQPNSDGS